MLKIRTDKSAYLIFVYFTLFTSFLHAVLRPSITSSLSLFRLLLPFLLISLLLKNGKYVKYLIYLLVFFIFNFLLSFLYTKEYTHFFVFVIHYLCIFTIFLAIHYLLDHDDFKSIYNFLKFSIYTFIIIWFTEIIFDYNLPNVSVYEDGSKSSVFWIQNELGTGIIGFFPFLLVFDDKKIQKVLFFFIIVFINFKDDSKMALVGTLAALIGYFIMTLDCKSRVLILNTTIITLVLSLTVFSHFIILDFRDYKISLYDMISDPVERILTLKPYPDNGGSIETRSDAAIYAIETLKKSHFLGIGIGNTITMLEDPEYHLKTAKSIHNLPLQLLVENGIIAFVLFAYLIYQVFKRLYNTHNSKISKLYVIICFSYFPGTLSSSVGIFSNYFFIVCLALALLINEKQVCNEF
jgi:hypothetical protein